MPIGIHAIAGSAGANCSDIFGLDATVEPLAAKLAAAHFPLRAALPVAGGAEVLDVELYYPFEDVADQLARAADRRPPLFEKVSNFNAALAIEAFCGSGLGVVTESCTKIHDPPSR